MVDWVLFTVFTVLVNLNFKENSKLVLFYFLNIFISL